MNKIYNYRKIRIFFHVVHRQNEMNEKFIKYVDQTTSLNKIKN